MIRIKWQPIWANHFGGFNSDYYNDLWEKHGQQPYLDSSYWVWWEQWFEKKVNGKFIRHTFQSAYILEIEFENESDAILFRLKCP